MALVLVYHNKGNKVPTTCRDNLTRICSVNDFLYSHQYLYIVQKQSTALLSMNLSLTNFPYKDVLQSVRGTCSE